MDAAEFDSGIESLSQDDEDSTCSLTSNACKFFEENRRTYPDSVYLFPNDERERDRLDLTHALWGLTWSEELCLSSGTKPFNRVLDMGTGTGIWAMDYAEDHPNAVVLGVDLSPIQPNLLPPNLEFLIDDVELEWVYKQRFDLIFSRNMFGSIEDWERLFRHAFEHLEPGGCLEIQDHTFPFRSDTNEDAFQASYLSRWSHYMVDAMKRAGRYLEVPLLESLLKEVGFTDVTLVEKKIPVGLWPRDKVLNDLGRFMGHMLLDGIEGLSLRPFTRWLEWSVEDLQLHLAEVRKDIRCCRHRRIHGYTIA